MIGFEDEKKTDVIREMLEQMEEIYTNLQLEYLDMARGYDEAMERVDELEADKIYLADLLSGREVL